MTDNLDFVRRCPRWHRALACLCGLVLLGFTHSAAAFTTNDVATIYSAYANNFYSVSGTRAYIKDTQTGGIEYFWGQAEEVECFIDAYEWSPTTAYKTAMTNLINGFSYYNGTDWSGNMYNDDIMWACIAYLRAYQNSGITTYRTVAKANFDMMYARAWDTTFRGGGLWWTTDNNTKNACINGPAAIAAYLLYLTLADTNYLVKAQNIYSWERTNLFNATSGAIYDAVSVSGGLSTWSSTYNQGTFIGAANFLGFTNDAMLAANYTKNSMTSSSGIMPQYGRAGNNSGFNAIFYRWMVKFIKDRGLQTTYLPWLQDNANAAWNVRRTTDNLSWCQWLQPTPTGINLDSWDCISSFEAMLVLPPTQSTAPGTVTLQASDAVGTASFKAGLNWSDATAPSALNNYIVSGLTLRTPADAVSYSFAGSSLILTNAGTLRLMTTSTGKVTTLGTRLYLDGGVVCDGTVATELAGVVTLNAGGGTFDPQSFGFTVSAGIGGTGALTVGSSSGVVGGTLTLSGNNTYTGGTVLNAGDILQLTSANSLGSSSASLTFSNTLSRGYGSVNLNGTNLAVGNLTGGGGKIYNNASGTVVTLTPGTGNATGGNFLGIIADHVSGTGTLGVNKVGTGTLTLSGANTYTAGTLVSGGTLVFGTGASGLSAGLQVESGAVCQLVSSFRIFNNAPQVTLKSGAQLYLGPVVNHAIGKLVLNGIVQPTGTWGSSSSSAANQNDVFFTGTGVLTVTNTLAPPALLVTPGNAQVALSWTNPTGATTYNVKRATVSGGPYTVIGANLTSTNFTDNNVVNAATYYYVASSVNYVGESVNSAESAVVSVGPPAPPTGVSAATVSSQAILTWGTSAGALGYNVKRSLTSGGPYSTLTSQGGTGYTDAGLVTGTRYWYVITATNAFGESLNSSEVSVKPGTSVVVLLTMDTNNTATTSFNGAGYWSDGLLPSATKDYLVPMSFAVSGTTNFGGLRTPDNSASYLFAGSSLTLSNGALRLRNSGATVMGSSAANGLLLDNGLVSAWKQPASLMGYLTLKSGGGMFEAASMGSAFTVSARIGGVGALTAGSDSNSFGGPILLTGVNTYLGGTVIAGPTLLQLSGAGTLGAAGGALTFKNSQQVPLVNANMPNRGFGTLDLYGTSQTVGQLSGAGGLIANNAPDGTSTLTLSNAGPGADFLGTIANHTTGGGVVALTKNGGGTSTFFGANTYTGATTIIDGTLRLGLPAPVTPPAPVSKWAADSLIGGDGTLIASWTDNLAGKIAVQATSSYRPRLYSNVMNGHKVVRFASASTQYLTVSAANSAISGAGDFTMLVVFKTATPGAASGNYYLNTGLLGCEQSGAVTDWGFCLNGSQLGAGLGTGDTACSTDFSLYGGSVTDNKPHLGMYVRSGSTIRLLVDGVLVATQSSLCTSARGAYDFQIGAMTAGAYCFNGDMAEIQLFNRALNSGELAAVGDSLARTYGIGTTPDAPVLNFSPVCQWSADSLSGSDGTSVSNWTDTVSSNRATQVTAGNQPQLYANVFNGHKALRFTSASSQYLTVAATNSPLSGAGDFSLVLVFKTTTAGAASSLFYQNTGLLGGEQTGVVADWAFCLNGSQLGGGLGAGSSGCNADVSLYGGYVTDGNPHVAMYVRSNSVVSLILDGVSLLSQSSLCTGVRGSYDFQIGAMTAGALCFNGDLAKLQIYPRALNTTEIAVLSQSLAATYGQGILSDTTALNLAGGTGVFDLNNHAETIGSLAGVSGTTVALNGGALVVGGNNTTTSFAGNFSGPGDFAKTGTGTLTLSGAGSVRNLNLAGGTLAVADGASLAVGFGGTNASALVITNGTLNLLGGTLTISNTGPAIAGAAGSSILNFNGGTLRAGAASAMFIQGLTAANVYAGGAVIDTSVYNLTVAQALLNGDPAGGLQKLGTGRLTLSKTNTYTGNTLVSAGTLALAEPATLTNSALVAVFGGAVVDVSSRTDQTLTVPAGQTLAGSGTVNGKVNALAGSLINPGDAIGTFTVQSDVFLGGTLLMELNRTNTQTSDQLVSNAGTITPSGVSILTVTNLGPALQAGDVFQLFSAPVSGFATVNLPALPASYGWTNRLALDGSLMVQMLVSTLPTNITVQVVNNTLTLTWPADHTGWRLQSQTNGAGQGLSSNWADVSGSTNVSQVNLPVDPANGSVFFRLVYP